MFIASVMSIDSVDATDQNISNLAVCYQSLLHTVVTKIDVTRKITLDNFCQPIFIVGQNMSCYKNKS